MDIVILVARTIFTDFLIHVLSKINGILNLVLLFSLNTKHSEGL